MGSRTSTSPVNFGMYKEWKNEQPVGSEVWRIYETTDSYVVSSRIERSLPKDHRYLLRFQTSRRWDPKRLNVWYDAGPEWRLISLQKSDDVISGRLEAWDQLTRGINMAFPPETQIDFGTLLFNAVTIRNLNLRQESDREFEVMFIPPETLEPTLTKQRYQHLADERLQTPMGLFSAKKYRLAWPDGHGYEFWTNQDGIVLKAVVRDLTFQLHEFK